MFSLIVLTFNGREFIGGCLDSILGQGHKDLEIIVVDNASEDGTAAFIEFNYPDIILIRNQKNLGAAKARNLGVEIAKGEWILALDCDVRLEVNFIRKFKEAIKQISPGIGIIQPKILYPDKKRIFSTGIFISPLKRFYDIGRGRQDGERFNTPGYVFGACSAAALYRRRMLEEIKDRWGYFDERFFFLFEDADLSWRAQEKGWRVMFYPDIVCFHHGNSSKTSKDVKQFLCWRNRKLMLKKHKLKWFNSLAILLFYDFPRRIALCFMNPYVRYRPDSSINNNFRISL